MVNTPRKECGIDDIQARPAPPRRVGVDPIRIGTARSPALWRQGVRVLPRLGTLTLACWMLSAPMRADELALERRSSLAAQLRALKSGQLAPDQAIPPLFVVRLEDREAVRDRIAELESELAALRVERDPAPPPSPSAATQELGPAEPMELSASDTSSENGGVRDDTASGERAKLRQLDLSIASDRLAYLRAWADLSASIPDAGRESLRSLTTPRAGLRAEAEGMRQLAASLGNVAARLKVVLWRLDVGAFVGFAGQLRDLEANLGQGLAAIEAAADALDARAVSLDTVAEELEAEGRSIRRTLLLAALAPDPQRSLDPLFLRSLDTQRLLRRRVQSVSLSSRTSAESFTRLVEESKEVAPEPPRVATLGAAIEVSERALTLAEQVNTLLRTSSAQPDSWRGVFFSEIVPLLAAVSSDQARNQGYAWSSELLGDMRAELLAGISRARSWTLDRAQLIRSWPRTLLTPAGAGTAARIATVVSMILLWFIGWRRNTQLVATGLRGLVRTGIIEARLGTAVRWASLIQAMLPPVWLYATFEVGLWILGPESTERRVLRAALLPAFAYVIGRQCLLGLTRRVTRGRPALLPLEPPAIDRLRRSYARLGLVVGTAVGLAQLQRATIGVGRFSTLTTTVIEAWIGIWILLEATRWRSSIAAHWQRQVANRSSASTAFEKPLAAWMGTSSLGVLLAPLALTLLASRAILHPLARTAKIGDWIGALRAHSLRRAAERNGTNNERVSLGPDYLEHFPLYPELGEDSSILLSREPLWDQARSEFQRWNSERRDGILLLVGEKGVGKTTFAGRILREIQDVEVHMTTLQGKLVTESAVCKQLSASFGEPELETTDLLVSRLSDGPPRMVIVDEAHNCVLRVIAGYRGFEALTEIALATSGHVFWVFLCNLYTWRLLQASAVSELWGGTHIELGAWSAGEIEELIRLRHRRTKYELDFDELLVPEDRVAGVGFDLVENADGYFRLLWEVSGGNPRVAAQLWLDSLRPSAPGRLRVGMFRTQHAGAERLSDELSFALAAITQHENLSAHELARVLNVDESVARRSLARLLDLGLIEPKGRQRDRVTLAAAAYPQVIRWLRNKHLLFEG